MALVPHRAPVDPSSLLLVLLDPSSFTVAGAVHFHSTCVVALQAKHGTPCYMAPELFQDGSTHSTASDLWALGCVLYECAAGRPPFVSSSLTHLVNDILATEPAPLPEGGVLAHAVSTGAVCTARDCVIILGGAAQKAVEGCSTCLPTVVNRSVLQSWGRPLLAHCLHLVIGTSATDPVASKVRGSCAACRCAQASTHCANCPIKDVAVCQEEAASRELQGAPEANPAHQS